MVFQPYLQKFAAYYYNRAAEWDKGLVVTHKFEAFPPVAAAYDLERGKLKTIRPRHWQTDTSVSYKSWCYIDGDHFKTVTTLVHTLVDAVSKNGNLLLNVGPRAGGTIPDEDIRFTTRDDVLYPLSGLAVGFDHDTFPEQRLAGRHRSD